MIKEGENIVYIGTEECVLHERELVSACSGGGGNI